MAEKDQNGDNASNKEAEEDVSDGGLDTDEEGGFKVEDDIYIPPPPRYMKERNADDPRLMITKIINVNFKSYAGTQIVGPFHKSFSAIVGPNGSGKSNVIDSMLFVFGYRASKIRSKKISVLIHNSSEHPNVTSCTVSVCFQRIIDKPGADYDVVPNSEFVISRTAFKDNSSYYEVNKKKVQFKEIAKLLRSHSVDLDHNRFLILQGEVEQIAMMKPKAQTENDTGMLEFLEDIIGTVRYKEPLEKLSEKVELLTEHRTDRLNRLRGVEKEKQALQEPMQNAIEYLKMENAIIKFQHQFCHCERFQTTKEFTEQEQKVAELDKDLSDLSSEQEKVHTEKTEKNKIMKEKSKQWEKWEQQKAEATAKYDKVRKHDESLHAEMVETNKRRKANMALLKTEKAKLEDLSKIPEKNAADIKEYESLAQTYMADREKEEAALATLMAGLREKTEPLLDERSKLETELISLRKDVDQAKGTFEIAKSELELYTSTEHNEKEKLEKLIESLKTTVDTLKEREQQLTSLRAKIPATRESLQRAQTELKEVKHREIEATSQLKQMRMVFEEKRSAMQASKSRNKILGSLMDEKRQGRMPGIFGRLGDLGAIDGKYDVAISTACGPLDNIVVDTVDTAQRCIKFLRDNDIGRATFIPLEKQTRFLSRCKQKIQTPENVPRLFDMIKVEDEKVLPAFYYGLQDTLVADNLDQATRIAYGQRRYRVVTLKGELIELSGTMSGGGRTAFKGRMGQKVVRNEPTAREVEKLQSELDVVFEECGRLRLKQQPLENQIETLATALNNMTIDMQKYEIEVQTLREQEPSLKMQLKDQEKKAKQSVSNPKKVQAMNNTVENAREKLNEAEEAANSVESEVKRINNEIDNISGNCVKNKQKKISELTKLSDKTRTEVCRLQVAIKTAERNIKKTTQHIETLENDVVTSENRIRDIQKEKQGLVEEATVLSEELLKLEEAFTERDEVLGSIKEELSALQARENKMKSVKIDLDQKLKEAKSFLKELKQRIVDYKRKIDELKLQAIPDEPEEELKEPTEEELNEFDAKVISVNLQKAKKRLPTEIPNMQIIDEYREKNALYVQRSADFEEITNQCNKMRDIYETVRRRRVQEFLTGFTLITAKLKEMYQMITLGGDAELELVDSLDPFSEGIVFSVRPPKKSWKNICNLSGGEKTLSSLALVFALHHFKPTPLYFMDEIDAALDFKNVSIVANYIKERTKNAQFIIISLRSNMFELADYLVGIYKTYNCTKSVTVHLANYYKANEIAPPTQITSSNSFPSQMQKYSMRCTQTQQKRGSQNIIATQSSEQNEERKKTDCLNLPNLGLSPSPEKAPAERRLSSPPSTRSRIERSNSTEPTKKRQKLF